MKAIAAAALLVLINAGVHSLDIEGIGLTGGVVWIGNGDDTGGPSPLKTTVGASFPVGLSPGFLVTANARAFAHDYEWTDDARAVPTEIETRDAFSVVSLLADVEATFRLPLGGDVIGGVSLAPTFLLRFPTTAYGDAEEDRAAMRAYFAGAGRFFYTGVGAYSRWNATDGVALVFRARGYPPLLQRLAEPNLPFYDQMLIEASVTVLFTFGGTAGESGGID